MRIKRGRRIIPGEKTACVARYGAYGDGVLLSPVFRQLKKDGYYVFFNCTEPGYAVLSQDPNIDCFLIQETNEIPNEELDPYWKKMMSIFTRFINLNGSIEEKLLAVPWKPEYQWDKEKRHAKMNVNYMDQTMASAGYPELKGEQPQLFFKKREEEWAEAVRKKYPGFLVVVSLSGSSAHKTYPYMSSVVHAMAEGLDDATILLVGEAGCRDIVDPHPRVVDMCGDFGIRRSYILTKIADLVISTETSVANASSCFDTPKIILLSHSSTENLTKYWRNCFPIEPQVTCYPCHKLHYTEKSCPTQYFELPDQPEVKVGGPVCTSLLSPEKILEKVELVYDRWKATNLQRTK